MRSHDDDGSRFWEGFGERVSSSNEGQQRPAGNGEEQVSQSGAPFLVRKPTPELVDDVIKAATPIKRGSKEPPELPDHQEF